MSFDKMTKFISKWNLVTQISDCKKYAIFNISNSSRVIYYIHVLVEVCHQSQ